MTTGLENGNTNDEGMGRDSDRGLAVDNICPARPTIHYTTRKFRGFRYILVYKVMQDFYHQQYGAGIRS